MLPKLEVLDSLVISKDEFFDAVKYDHVETVDEFLSSDPDDDKLWKWPEGFQPVGVLDNKV